MSTLTGRLTITVCDAKDLNSDQYGRVNPYCALTFPGCLCNRHFKTRAHKRGGNAPIWDESHTFNLKRTKTDAKLKISLYDHAIFKDQALGRAKIYLAELLEHCGKKQYYEILEKRPDYRVAGYVGIIADFDNHDHKGESGSQPRLRTDMPATQSQMQQSQPQMQQPQMQQPQMQQSQPQMQQSQPQTQQPQTQQPQMQQPQMQQPQMQQPQMQQPQVQQPQVQQPQVQQPQVQQPQMSIDKQPIEQTNSETGR